MLLAGGDQREWHAISIDRERPRATRKRPRNEPQRPPAPRASSRTAAPSTTRTQARNAGGTPSSTATLMNR